MLEDILFWTFLVVVGGYALWYLLARANREIGEALAEADRECDPYHQIGARRD